VLLLVLLVMVLVLLLLLLLLLLLQDAFCTAFRRASPDFQTRFGYEVDAPNQANMAICSNQVGQESSSTHCLFALRVSDRCFPTIIMEALRHGARYWIRLDITLPNWHILMIATCLECAVSGCAVLCCAGGSAL
jgi:hypothetical protein